MTASDDGTGVGRGRDAQGAVDGRGRRGARRRRRASTAPTPRTSLVLAKALERPTGLDLVVAGMASTDARHGRRPGDARRAARAAGRDARRRRSTVADGKVTIRRDTDDGQHDGRGVAAGRGRVVTDQTGEPRYPSFKGIMAAKKKPVETLHARRPRHRCRRGRAVGRLDRGRVRDRAAAARQAGEGRHDEGDGRRAAGRVPRRAEVHLRERDDDGRDPGPGRPRRRVPSRSRPPSC